MFTAVDESPSPDFFQTWLLHPVNTACSPLDFPIAQAPCGEDPKNFTYPLVICYVAIENGHLVRGFSHKKLGFSSSLC